MTLSIVGLDPWRSRMHTMRSRIRIIQFEPRDEEEMAGEVVVVERASSERDRSGFDITECWKVSDSMCTRLIAGPMSEPDAECVPTT